MSNILNSYHGCQIEDIMNMSEQELREAVIRVFSLEFDTFAPTDSWMGTFMLPDKIADAFRDRI